MIFDQSGRNGQTHDERPDLAWADVVLSIYLCEAFFWRMIRECGSATLFLFVDITSLGYGDIVDWQKHFIGLTVLSDRDFFRSCLPMLCGSLDHLMSPLLVFSLNTGPNSLLTSGS